MRYLLIILFLGINLQVQDTHEIYVSPMGSSINSGSKESPFQTIQQALDNAIEFRLKNNNIKIVIHVLEGEYHLKSPIRITPELGDLKIIGEGLDKVIIKGSKQLNLKWKKYNKSIWVAQVGINEDFDQIFVNGEQQILARYPNYNEQGGHWQGHAADAVSPERLKSWKNPRGAIVHAMHSGEWGGFHYFVTSKDEKGELVLTGGHQNNRPSEMHKTYRMVENVFEELDSPGEWFLDTNKKKLFYWPQNTSNLKNAIVEGVQLKHLVEIVGEKNNPSRNLSIEGIRFEHTNRTINEVYEPLLRSDWNIYRGGAIFIENTENVTIKDCEFVNLGGNVIFVSKYNRKTKIEGNHIHDCGASGVSFVGDPSAVRSPSFQYGKFVTLNKMDTVSGPANSSYPSESIVANNLIYRIGRVEKQTAGVQISMAMDITVSHNSIYDVPRAGINVSEGTWGGHIIENNDVFNTVLETSDHGAFNSWGRDRFWHPNRQALDKITTENPKMPYWDAIHTTVIRNNRFRCDQGWDIDLDDGSSNYEIYNNVCLNGGIKLREGFYRTVENNIMVNNSFHPHVWFKKSGDIFRKNIVMTEYRDIRLQGWGKEIDYNLFPTKAALEKAQNNGTDLNSLYANPSFLDAKEGNYTIPNNSPALKLGFKNIPMDSFGVRKQEFKRIAKKPDFPVIWSVSDSDKKEAIIFNWIGAKVKNIKTLEERSAFGLNKTAGVLILEIDKESIIEKSELKEGDVIITGENENIDNIPDLMSIYGGHRWKGVLNIEILRNQKPLNLKIYLK